MSSAERSAHDVNVGAHRRACQWAQGCRAYREFHQARIPSRHERAYRACLDCNLTKPAQGRRPRPRGSSLASHYAPRLWTSRADPLSLSGASNFLGSQGNIGRICAFRWVSINSGGPIPMGRSEEYRRFAAECLEMAGAFDNPQARAVLLQMAQVWFRLAGEATASGNAPQSETCSD